MTQEGSNSDSSSVSCFESTKRKGFRQVVRPVESLYFKRSLHFSLGGLYQNAVLHIRIAGQQA